MIYHLMEDRLEEGTVVVGTIDWEKRFARMQQHSGEHIVSGIIHSRFGYDNVGFHLGEEVCTLDVSGPLTKAELKEIEEQANAVVFQNLPVEVLYPSKEELAVMTYRSKIEIEGQVRIVRIGEVDICACCAPHVKQTGEIGLIKFIQSQNYKGGVRITMLCGSRALRDYQAEDEQIKQIMATLCVRKEEVSASVEQLKEEKEKLKNRVYQLEIERLEEKARAYKGRKTVCVFEQIEGKLLKEYMNLILANEVEVCAVFTGTEADGYRYVIGSRQKDIRAVAKTLNERFDGRGGGKKEMVQGTLWGEAEQIRRVFEEL